MNNKCYFVLAKDDAPVRAGQVLKGQLVIPLSQTTNLLQCGGRPLSASTLDSGRLQVYLEGKEFTKIHETGPAHNPHTKQYDCQFLNLQLKGLRTNTNSDDVLKIPIELRIPSGVPSSMDVTLKVPSNGRIKEQAVISYTLSAILDGTVEARHSVHVLAKTQPTRIVPAIVPPISPDITSFSVANQGDMTVAAKIMDTLVVPGQKVKVRIAVVNDSTAALQSVDIALIQRTDYSKFPLQEQRHIESLNTTLATTTFLCDSNNNETLADRDILKQSFNSKQRRQEDNHQRVLHELLCKKVDKEHEEGVTVLNCAIEIPPATGVADTRCGTLIQVTHHVSIQLNTKVFFTNPGFKFPIKIVQGAIPTSYQEEKLAEEIPNCPPLLLDDNNHQQSEKAMLEDLITKVMSQSTDDLHIIEERLPQPKWNRIFASLTPYDFGRLLEQVHLEVNLIPVATLLASRLTQELFSCSHIVAGLPHTTTATRCTFVEQLLPYCHDLQDNYTLITKNTLLLSQWERLAIEPAVQEALEHAKKYKDPLHHLLGKMRQLVTAD